MNIDKFKTIKNIHFIGIGGIGLSALAKFLLKKGYNITGSDIHKNFNTDDLVNTFNIYINIYSSMFSKINIHKVKEIDLVIYSSVIKDNDIEYLYFKNKGILCLSRKDALKYILKDKTNYVVAGSHGKSTTTAMLTSILKKTSSIIGAVTKEFNSNMRYYKNNNKIIFEGDESDESFLNSNPDIAIVTNTEPEHMDYYKYDYDKFYNSYKKFLNLAKIRIINAEDKFLKSLDIKSIKFYPSKDIKNITYEIKNNEPYTTFSFKKFGRFKVFGLGEHTISNASLAILTAIELGVDVKTIRSNLLNYKGIKKRFDIIYHNNNNIIIDDYGHHPTEITATINSLCIYQKLINFNKIQVIWQPHKYTRTVENLRDYIKCFKGVDELVILPVWSAGESNIDIDFKNNFSKYNLVIADKITQTNNQINIIKNGYILKSYESGITISFGAGDITNQIRGLI